MIRAMILSLLLVACSGQAPTPTPEPTQTLDERIATYVQSFGGSASQYHVILTLDRCKNLDRLLGYQMEKMEQDDELGPASPEWRQALGYANAINERQQEIDC